MPALADWQADSLRVTVFTNELTTADWGALWPSEPTVSLTERREQPNVRSVTQVGTYERWQITVQSQLDRVDLTVSAPPTTGPIVEFPSAGTFDELVAAIKLLLPAAYGKKISRVAFGAVLLRPADSHESAYANLGQYLPRVQIDPKSRDFFYQVNRPLAADGHWPEINRVSQWAAIKSAWINPSEVPATTLEMFATRLILDINTAPSATLSVADAIPGELLDLLISEARKIASTGDL